MKKATKFLIPIGVLLLIVFISYVYTYNVDSKNKVYEIVNYYPGTCTFDIPSSYCSGASVTVISEDSKTHKFRTNGYSEKSPSEYDDEYKKHTNLMYTAYSEKKKVRLSTSGDEIRSVEILD